MKIIDVLTSRLLLIFLQILNFRKIYNPNHTSRLSLSVRISRLLTDCCEKLHTYKLLKCLVSIFKILHSAAMSANKTVLFCFSHFLWRT